VLSIIAQEMSVACRHKINDLHMTKIEAADITVDEVKSMLRLYLVRIPTDETEFRSRRFLNRVLSCHDGVPNLEPKERQTLSAAVVWVLTDQKGRLCITGDGDWHSSSEARCALYNALMHCPGLMCQLDHYEQKLEKESLVSDATAAPERKNYGTILQMLISDPFRTTEKLTHRMDSFMTTEQVYQLIMLHHDPVEAAVRSGALVVWCTRLCDVRRYAPFMHSATPTTSSNISTIVKMAAVLLTPFLSPDHGSGCFREDRCIEYEEEVVNPNKQELLQLAQDGLAQGFAQQGSFEEFVRYSRAAYTRTYHKVKVTMIEAVHRRIREIEEEHSYMKAKNELSSLLAALISAKERHDAYRHSLPVFIAHALPTPLRHNIPQLISTFCC